MAEEVRIDLKSTADTSGFDKMGAASKEAGIGIGAASKESKALAGDLGRSVEVGSASVGLFQNIATASQGGAAGLAAAARAGLGFGQMLKGILAGAGPVGIILAGVGVAAGALVAAFSKPKQATEDLAKAFDSARQKGEEMAKAQSVSLAGALKTVQTELGNTITKLQEQAAAHDEVARAADNQAKAEINAMAKSGRMSAEQAEAATAGIDAAATAREVKNRVDALRKERDETQKAADRAASIASTPRAALEALLAERDSTKGRSTDLNRASYDLRAARSAAYERKNPFGVPFAEMHDYGGDAETRDRVLKMDAAQKAFNDALAAAPDKATMEELDKSVAQAWKDWEAASQPVQQLTESVKRLNDRIKLREQTDAEIKTINDTGKQRAEKLTANPVDRDKQIARMQSTPESIWRAQAASGGVSSDDRALFRTAFPGAKTDLPDARLQPVTDSLNKAADAAEKAPDAKPAADAADRLAKATETSATEQAAALAQVVSALSAATAVAAQSVEMSSALAGKIVALQQRLNTLAQQQAAARQRIAT